MELPCITLQTTDRDSFLHSDGYREVTDSELETLLQQCRAVAVSLEEEIENRQTISHEPPTGIKESCEKLHKSSRSIRVLGRLDVRDEKLVRAGIEIMSTAQTIRPSKVYQVFLKDILRHCGSALVLLCSASLGKHRIVSLSGPDRIALVHYVKGKRASLSSSALELLAEEYKIPSKNSTLPTWLSMCKAKSSKVYNQFIWWSDQISVCVVKVCSSFSSFFIYLVENANYATSCNRYAIARFVRRVLSISRILRQPEA